METIALIVAAGRGARFGDDGPPKQYRRLAGVPVLRHALDAFTRHPRIQAVRTVIRAGDEALYARTAAGLGLLEPVPGGETRQESVRLGLESLVEREPARVLVHDAARPFASPALVDRVLDALGESDGAVPALPLADTLKHVGDGGRIVGTVPREGLWRAQTPQGFRYAAILNAHRAARGGTLTDDAAVAEAAGMSVAIVAGDEANAKITTGEDLRRAEAAMMQGGRIAIGSGFDVHRFGPGDSVRLCGIDIPHDSRLEGHSDSDVGLHAITDALLGAAASSDIGGHFPPSDPQWKGADSAIFLHHARSIVAEAAGVVEHLDVTLICERPKVGPHRDAMRGRIAGLLGIDVGRVSVKATTTERLGFTGRGEGIAAQATATVRFRA
ncbi:MAG: bifunctional 2-C-methyl-D-erythritol 4-phosphate cytidylyltransferase/2-C-methyl-D-erythritol 2,4-cyclodiphosphate synthase [Acetobacterales bacterium]